MVNMFKVSILPKGGVKPIGLLEFIQALDARVKTYE